MLCKIFIEIKITKSVKLLLAREFKILLFILFYYILLFFIIFFFFGIASSALRSENFSLGCLNIKVFILYTCECV